MNSQIEKLKAELEIAQKDIADFELLAVEWRKGYEKLKQKYNIEVSNLKQEIEELKIELRDRQ